MWAKHCFEGGKLVVNRPAYRGNGVARIIAFPNGVWEREGKCSGPGNFFPGPANIQTVGSVWALPTAAL